MGLGARDRYRSRLRDIVEHARAASDTVRGISHQDFDRNAVLQKSVCFDLLCISEATARLLDIDPDIAKRHPTVPWKQVRAIANVLRHEYHRIDMDVVWNTVAGEDLDGLTAAVSAELERTDG